MIFRRSSFYQTLLDYAQLCQKAVVVIVSFLFFFFFIYIIVVVVVVVVVGVERSCPTRPSIATIPAAASSSVRISYRNGAIQALLHKDTAQAKPELIASRRDKIRSKLPIFATNFDTASYRATYPHGEEKRLFKTSVRVHDSRIEDSMVSLQVIAYYCMPIRRQQIEYRKQRL